MTTTAQPAVAAVEHQSTTPLRHPARWIATALVVILLLNFGQTVFTNPQWEWTKVGKWFFSPACRDLHGVALARSRQARPPLGTTR